MSGIRIDQTSFGRSKQIAKTLSLFVVMFSTNLGGLQAQENTVTLTAPALSVASNFSQSWLPDILDASDDVPVFDYRDEIHWNDVEKVKGHFLYRGWRFTYPSMLKARNKGMVMVMIGRNVNYDDGGTPYTAEGVAAYGRYVAETVKKFPAIHTVEVENEFNSEHFVFGKPRTQDLQERAAYYVALLKSAYEQVKAVRPDVTVVGGAAHSIPVGYLKHVFALGGRDYMDALALHPYDTLAEQIPAQVQVLRRLADARDLPIQMTEFGTTDSTTAPGHLMRNYCQMALSGVERAVWYPLHPRGDGLVPLLTADGQVTPTGQAYRSAQQMFAGHPVENAANDPFTYGCSFGPNRMLLWGARRTVTIDPGVTMRDASGNLIDGTEHWLSEADPVIFLSESPLTLGGNIRLGSHGVLADTLYQFNYPDDSHSDDLVGFELAEASKLSDEPEHETSENLVGLQVIESPDSVKDQSDLGKEFKKFQVFARSNSSKIPLSTKLGQERQGVPWTPYIGSDVATDLRLSANYLAPEGNVENPVEIVHRFTAKENSTVEVSAYWQPGDGSEDGIRVSVSVNGIEKFTEVSNDDIAISGRSLTLKEGDKVDFVVGPNGSHYGDYSRFRITLKTSIPGALADLGSGG